MPESIMAPTFGDLVKREFSRDYCRETFFLMPRSAGYPQGAVLGRITESGKYALSTAKATDGSEMSCVVLVGATAGSAADIEAVAIVRFPCPRIADKDNILFLHTKISICKLSDLPLFDL